MNADESRGYSKGYAAGRRRQRQEHLAEALRKEQQSFLDRVFIACIAEAMHIQGWKIGDKPVTTIPDRITVARDFALDALRRRPRV